ncbi:hypothetical protein Ciccas_013730 [Cichlidogyrus casuarinus]|uniref:Uncharacterized protein n=1 Tax=Cichlidogyrus casuarinus TaxID=1844966 RepID=A0ABD2PMW9_9PLAT
MEKNEKIGSSRNRKQRTRNCLRQLLHCWCLSMPKEKPNKTVDSLSNCAQSFEATVRLVQDDRESQSNELYQFLVNAKDPLHDCLVKFLEQKIGILVLGSCLAKSSPQTAIALQIVTVATYEQSLRRMCGSRTAIDAESGKARQVLSLPHDLVDVFRQAGALDRLQVRDLRLAAGWSPQELQEALDESFGNGTPFPLNRNRFLLVSPSTAIVSLTPPLILDPPFMIINQFERSNKYHLHYRLFSLSLSHELPLPRQDQWVTLVCDRFELTAYFLRINYCPANRRFLAIETLASLHKNKYAIRPLDHRLCTCFKYGARMLS